ncbi:MAG: CDGSH iron-sulfur domain-containing protein [Polyangiaceae bacterium]|nr:CDGSH iron-sulfur domain-containing protein [Polyangiaceae bacterium]
MSDKITKYPGKHLDVFWDGRLCIHVGECGRAENALFEGGRQPWCQPDTVDADAATNVVERCPTGALSYTRHDDGPEEAAFERNVVTVANNGPLYVAGELEIEGAAPDMPGVRFRAALCRCGQSKNKPFCDNSHEDAGFKDHGAVGANLEDENAGSPTQGALSVKPAASGPLLLTGEFELVAASGRVAMRANKAALCRCGHSKNKPFCDGSHKAAGFTGE